MISFLKRIALQTREFLPIYFTFIYIQKVRYVLENKRNNSGIKVNRIYIQNTKKLGAKQLEA
ncbi:hypothetical protein BpHYR1_049549 [Brachionus plicatilis]|uniref:Uncharacterized protein n=1 Tax=Brachionus plicatilis TaxID=10195 RepID=A0A3M7SAT1_BRAPC|nr:hypothetical protein BpHYR1_049549 [Brachionus plicatilis]